MPADAAAAAAAAETACIDAAAAWTACIMSGGYLPPGAPAVGNGGAAAGPPGVGPKCGYGRGPPKGPNGPAAPGKNGNPAPFDGDPPFGGPAVGIQDPGRCILYIASSSGWIGLG